MAGKNGDMSAIDDHYGQLGGPGGFLGVPVDEGAGNIRVKWSQLGGHKSFLGYPVTDETGTPDGRGRFNHFEGGSVYWTPETGPHEVHGDIRGKWQSMGWETSFLGYPTSDEHSPKGDAHTRISAFEGGHIVWTPESGADARKRID
jgi:uncharacterized protein with LGFP repeats